jgi:protein SCO1/2
MRNRMSLLIVLAACLVAIGALAVVAVDLKPQAASRQVAVGGPFSLTDEDGKTITDADMKGHPFIVFFGFTHCPDVCPTTLYDLSQALNGLGDDAKNIPALFVTVDPERDTPEVMKRYVSNFNPDIRGVTGDPAAIQAMVKAYRGYAKKVPTEDGDYTMDHTAVVYLMDADGKFIAPLNLQQPTADVVKELRQQI